MVWRKVDQCIDEGNNIRVGWTPTHTTLEEKAKMTPENQWAVRASEKADESAKTGTIQDGAEVAERIAEYALDTRKKGVCGYPIRSHFP